VAFESHGTNQSELIHLKRLLIQSAHVLKEKPRRHAHSPHIVKQTPPAPRLASTTRGREELYVCHPSGPTPASVDTSPAWKKQALQSVYFGGRVPPPLAAPCDAAAGLRRAYLAN